MELASSENHHKPHNIKPRFNNFTIYKKYIYNSQSEQAQINLHLVVEFRKLEFRLNSVAGSYNSRILRVSRFLNRVKQLLQVSRFNKQILQVREFNRETKVPFSLRFY